MIKTGSCLIGQDNAARIRIPLIGGHSRFGYRYLVRRGSTFLGKEVDTLPVHQLPQGLSEHHPAMDGARFP